MNLTTTAFSVTLTTTVATSLFSGIRRSGVLQQFNQQSESRACSWEIFLAFEVVLHKAFVGNKAVQLRIECYFLCTEEIMSLLLILSEVLAIILVASRGCGQDQGFTMQSISHKHIDSPFFDTAQYWSPDKGAVTYLCEWQVASFSHLQKYLQTLPHPEPSSPLFFSAFSNTCLASSLQCIYLWSRNKLLV